MNNTLPWGWTVRRRPGGFWLGPDGWPTDWGPPVNQPHGPSTPVKMDPIWDVTISVAVHARNAYDAFEVAYAALHGDIRTAQDGEPMVENIEFREGSDPYGRRLPEPDRGRPEVTVPEPTPMPQWQTGTRSGTPEIPLH